MHAEPNADFWRNADELVNKNRIVIDRPRGSRHPRFPSIVYPVAYGYLEGTTAVDGSGVDVWVGENAYAELHLSTEKTQRRLPVDAIVATIDLQKQDAEIKLLVECSKVEIEQIMRLTNELETFQGLLILRSPDSPEAGQWKSSGR